MGSMVPLLQLHNLHTGTHAWNITYGELIEMLRVSLPISVPAIVFGAESFSTCTKSI